MKGTKKARRRIGFGLGKFEVVAAFAGLIVVFGIWIESRAEIRWAFRHHVWIPQAIGATLIALGVFAEVIITALAAREARRADLDAEERIAAATTRVAEISERAANAERAAAEANERAGLLESANLNLRADLERVITKSAVEQRKTAEAQEKAAKAQQSLTQNLTSFARRSGDRVLDFQKFVDGLKISPVLTVAIWYTSNSEEAERFSDEIERALEYAKWPVSRRTFTLEDSLSGIPASRVRGMLFFFHDEEDMGSIDRFDGFMWSLLHALRFGGASEAATTAPELPKGTVVLVIGPKVKV